MGKLGVAKISIFGHPRWVCSVGFDKILDSDHLQFETGKSSHPWVDGNRFAEEMGDLSIEVYGDGEFRCLGDIWMLAHGPQQPEHVQREIF